MKKFTLLLLAMLSIAGAHAKVVETKLWSGTDAAGSTHVVEISASNISGLKAGDAIRVYITNTAGASYAIWYGTDKETTPRLTLSAHSNGWGWVDSGKAYEDVILSAEDVTNLTGKKIFIQISNTASTELTKVAHHVEVTPSSESDNLLDANWEGSATPKILSAINSVKMGDGILFTVSIAEAYTWIQFKLTDRAGNVDCFTGSGSEYQGNGDGSTTFTFEFTISTLNDLWTIMNSGFGIKKTYADGAFTITAVKLLSYDDSYDYTIDIEMGSDGYMTYSNSVNLDFSGTGLTPYYASEATKGTVTLTSATTTWNWQGYILRGPAGTHSPKVVADANASYPSGNLLRGQVSQVNVYRSVYAEYTDGNDDNDEDESTDEYKIKNNYRYIFAKMTEGDANIGFYKLTSDHTLGANKAYLETTTDVTPDITPSEPGAPAIHLVFEEENNATALDSSAEANRCVKVIQNGRLLIIKNGVTYDLTGNVVR